MAISADEYKLTIIAQHIEGGRQMVNNLYFNRSSSLVLDTPEQDLMEAWQGEVETDFKDLFTNQLSIVQYKIGRGPSFNTTFIKDVSVTGTASGDAMPAHVGAIMAFQTEEFTRRGRGRTFIFPANESVNTSDGRPSGAYKDAVEAVAGLILNAMSTITLEHAAWVWEMFSRADQEVKLIVSARCRGFWGSQRDRRGVY